MSTAERVLNKIKETEVKLPNGKIQCTLSMDDILSLTPEDIKEIGRLDRKK